MEKLAGAMVRSPFLMHLNFQDNAIGVEGVRVLAAGISQCPCLLHLDLDHTSIGGEEIARLVGAASPPITCPSRSLQATALTRKGLGGSQRCYRTLHDWLI